jgi:formin-binding protein 1
VALEREYAGKLQALAKKASDKKNKMEISFIIGNDQSKSWDAHIVEQRSGYSQQLAVTAKGWPGFTMTSTLNKAYTELITSTASIAQDHIDAADTLNTQVVDLLKTLERKNDEMKKKVGENITCGSIAF